MGIYKLKHKCQTRGKIFPAYIKEGPFPFYTNNISTNGQEAHEKMLSITNYSRKAIKNTLIYHLTEVRIATIKKSTNNAGENVGKRKPSSTVGRNKIGIASMKNSMEDLQKTRSRVAI